MNDIQFIEFSINDSRSRIQPALYRLNGKYQRAMRNFDAAYRRRNRRRMKKWSNRGMKIAARHLCTILLS